MLMVGTSHATTTTHIDILESALKDSLVNRDINRSQQLRDAIAERRDWYDNRPGIEYGTYIIVNVAAQRARLVEHDKITFDEKVIVGRDGMETPTFDDKIIDIVFNPVWNIPPDLASDMLPKMKAVGGWNGYNVYVDGMLVDSLDDVDVGMEYRIVQDPSESNALGTLKFNLPNQYGVYLHDTSSRHLFEETDRRFSAGCVRVQHADVLASKLLNWEVDAVHSTIMEQTTFSIPLPSPINVFIVDWQVDVATDGTVVYIR